MDRRTLLKLLGLAGAAGAAGAPLRAFGASAARPNIVWFRSEDNSASFIGAYGDPLAKTPTIDQLALDGVRFENYFSTSPVCAPSKLATLTGMYEASLGPGHNMRANAQPPAFVRGFASYLVDVGYWCTEQAGTRANPDHNTDLPNTGYTDTSGDWRKRPPGKPFFALLGSNTTHETAMILPLPGATKPADVTLPAYHPDSAILRNDRAHYMNQITKMDGEVAAVLAKLDEDGLTDDTIFIYSSDHGGVLPRSKRFCYDSGLRAPMIVRFGANWAHLAPTEPGGVYTPPASSIDQSPTILGLAGIEVPGHFHGQAFAGPDARPRQYAFSGRNRMDEQLDFVRTVRDDRYRYIRNYMPHLIYGQHNQFMWLQAGVRDWECRFRDGKLNEVQSRFWKTKPAEEFYDLQADPDEVNNLIASPIHTSRINQMRHALDQHMLRINDNGFIPEGMSAEGWDASRLPGAYPLSELLDLGALAIRRQVTNLPTFKTGLTSDNEVVRYWSAMACSMLGSGSSPVQGDLLEAATRDSSLWVRAQAADALLATRKANQAITLLSTLVATGKNPESVRLQAIWSLARAKTKALLSAPMLTVASADLGNVGNAARYAVREVTGTYIPAP